MKTLPLGLSTSPAVLQQLTNNTLEDIDGVEVYQDDVTVHTPNKATHDGYRLKLLQRFQYKIVAANA